MIQKATNLFLYLLCLVQIANGQDVRNCKWGMTSKQVRALEKGKFLMQKLDNLMYEVTADGDTYYLLYMFKNDSLRVAGYGYKETHVNDQMYYVKFLKIAEKLTMKYGEKVDETEWNNDLYKDDPMKYGFAASMGHVTFLYRYKTENTMIALALNGDNFKCTLSIYYYDINHLSEDKTDF